MILALLTLINMQALKVFLKDVKGLTKLENLSGVRSNVMLKPITLSILPCCTVMGAYIKDNGIQIGMRNISEN